VRRKIETLPRDVSETQVDAAEALLRELLIDDDGHRARRPCDVKHLAEARGLRIEEGAWSFARKRLDVTSRHLGGNVWCWSIGDDDLEAGFAEWLDSPAGRFATWYAQRDRIQPRSGAGLDEQLSLEVG
jgi:hypothetical protein